MNKITDSLKSLAELVTNRDLQHKKNHFQSQTEPLIIFLSNYAVKSMLLQKNFLQNLHYNRYNVLSQIFNMSILSTQSKIIGKYSLSNLLIIRILYYINGKCFVQKA